MAPRSCCTPLPCFASLLPQQLPAGRAERSGVTPGCGDASARFLGELVSVFSFFWRVQGGGNGAASDVCLPTSPHVDT